LVLKPPLLPLTKLACVVGNCLIESMLGGVNVRGKGDGGLMGDL
jgi:hypothetical protein